MDKKNKKLLLIFPPQWTPISPHFAIPSLIGQLKLNGFIAEAMDLNIDFYNDILSKENILNSITQASNILKELQSKLLTVFSPNKTPNDYTLDEQIFLYRYNQIKKTLQNLGDKLKLVPELIESSVNTIKSEDFYDPVKLIYAINIIDNALEIISLPYLPTKIGFEAVLNPFFKFNYENIKYFVLKEETNIFKKYYEKKINEILEKKADFIAISLNSSSQIISGLTLTKMLKEKTNAHINIGGNFFGRIADELKAHKEFFEIFADSVTVEEGEGPIVEIGKYINGMIKIEEVPNLLYLKDDVVYKTEKMKPLKLNQIASMNLDDYDFKKYFAPEIVLPYQYSRGCYWGKCSFCDQDFGQSFNVKNADKVIKEFIEFKEKYNISSYEFIDESVGPTYLDELSNKIKENNLDVQFFMDARLETNFTSDILYKAQKAGLRMVMWGLESGSRKVLELINKGIDIDKRFEILKRAKDAGIWNFAFIFFGFPAETKEDAKMTIDMLTKNNNLIHSYGRSVYTMGRHSKLAQDPEKYGISKIYPAEEEFSPNINFDCVGMTKGELKEVLEICLNKCREAYKNPIWMYLRYREWLFLYISRFGSEKVQRFRINQ